MGKINVGRVIGGGLLAGVVIDISETILNTSVLGSDWEAAMSALNRPPIGNQAIGVFMVMGLVLGIVTVWLYAAIRPRFGAGPKTAAVAGLAVWFFAYLYGGIGFLAMDIVPARLIVISVIWGIVETVVASVAGAALYKE